MSVIDTLEVIIKASAKQLVDAMAQASKASKDFVDGTSKDMSNATVAMDKAAKDGADKLAKSMDNVAKEAKKVNDGFGDVDLSLSSLVGKSGMVLGAITAVAAGFTLAFRAGQNYAEMLDNVSDATGLTAGQVDLLNGAAIESGVGADSLTAAVQRMNLVIGGAMDGSKQATDSLKKLGISVQDVAQLSTFERLKLVASGLGEISDQATRASMSAQILGKSSSKLDGLITDLNASLEKSKNSVLFNEEQVNKASASWEAFGKNVGSAGRALSQTAMVMMDPANFNPVGDDTSRSAIRGGPKVGSYMDTFAQQEPNAFKDEQADLERANAVLKRAGAERAKERAMELAADSKFRGDMLVQSMLKGAQLGAAEAVIHKERLDDLTRFVGAQKAVNDIGNELEKGSREARLALVAKDQQTYNMLSGKLLADEKKRNEELVESRKKANAILSELDASTANRHDIITGGHQSEDADYNAKFDAMNKFHQQGVISTEAYYRAIQQLTTEHNAKVAEMDNAAAMARVKMIESHAGATYQQKLDAFDEDMKLTEEQHTIRVKRLEADREEGIITQKEYDAALERENETHQMNMTAVTQQQAQLRQQAEQMVLGAMGNMFGAFANAMDQKKKDQFNAWKAFAIAQAVVSTYLAASNAMATAGTMGPHAAIAATVMVVAAGLANVAKIASTQYQGGGSSAGAVGGGGGGAAGGGGSGAGAAGDKNPGQTNVNVALYGTNFSDDQVRGLIGLINQQQSQNMVVKAA